MKKFLKKFLSSCFLTRALFSKIQSRRTQVIRERRRKQIQNSGAQTVKKLQKFFEEQNVTFFFDMGTLLGIIREGRLLKHDLDIDAAVITTDPEKIESIKKGLVKIGCKHVFRFNVEGIGICEDSYVFNNIKFDINYYNESENKSLCYLAYCDPEKTYSENEMDTVVLSCDKIGSTVKVDFEGEQINAPKEPEKYLAQRYGENWRVPDKNYIYWRGPSAAMIPNKTTKSKF